MSSSQRADHAHAIVVSAGMRDMDATLTALDFQVIATASLLDGYTKAYRLLASTSGGSSTLILVDLAGIEPTYPLLSAPLLVAALARQMRLREIRPAWLIGLAAAPTPQMEIEARVAGCHHLLPLPLPSDGPALLSELATRRPPILHRTDTPSLATEAIAVFQSTAQRVIEAARAVQAHTWTEEEVILLLRWLTPYPIPSTGTSQPLDHPATQLQAERLIQMLGGPPMARQRLEAIVAAWQQRYSLHSEILRKFLAGWERREIVHSIVNQGLYEDSRIYHCVKELPGRIAAYLRQEQMATPYDQIQENV
jgi:hypothetical protein